MSLKTLRTLLCTLLLLSTFASADAQAPSRLRPFQRDGKWGYVDASGKEVIGPRFVWAEEFSEGLAAFESDEGRHGYIDKTGKTAFKVECSEAGRFIGGLASLHLGEDPGEKRGYVNRQGKFVLGALPLQVQVARREDKPATVGRNSVKFRSNSYDTDRAIIEVRW